MSATQSRKHRHVLAAALLLVTTYASAVAAHADELDEQSYPVSAGMFFLTDQNVPMDLPDGVPAGTSVTLSVDGEVIAWRTDSDGSNGTLTPGVEYVVEAQIPDGYQLVSCTTWILMAQIFPVGWDVGVHVAPTRDPDDPFFDQAHHVCFTPVDDQGPGPGQDPERARGCHAHRPDRPDHPLGKPLPDLPVCPV